jgi:hypothetical protein
MTQQRRHADDAGVCGPIPLVTGRSGRRYASLCEIPMGWYRWLKCDFVA